MRLGFIIPDVAEPWDSVHQGIGYVAAFAKQELPGCECAVFRTYGRERSEVREFVARGWDLLGLTMTAVTVHEASRIARMPRLFGLPSKVVLGGAHVTSEEEAVFEQVPGADFAIVGEGEHTFVELARALASGGELGAIAGLMFRDARGIHKNPPRPWEPDLERFPPPDRTLFEYPYHFHSIIATRGCPFACAFCNSSANWGRRYRVRKPSAIADEMRAVIALYGKDRPFAFNDDIFNIKKEWVLEVCDELRRLDVKWWIRGLKVELVDEEMVDAFASSGCLGGACGIESADNGVLKQLGKGTTIEKMLRGVELFRARGVHLLGQFMIGNLGDTIETVKRSIEVAKRFDESTFGIAYPIPHTKLYDYVKQHGLFLDPPVPIPWGDQVIDYVKFATPEFTVEERLEAVRLALEARVYREVDYSKPPPGEFGATDSRVPKPA
ncbi:MAG TPA: radical SAM protein [Polyangia bacterium]|nr:radical SAM protein [Polyangia bacterium]